MPRVRSVCGIIKLIEISIHSAMYVYENVHARICVFRQEWVLYLSEEEKEEEEEEENAKINV